MAPNSSLFTGESNIVMEDEEEEKKCEREAPMEAISNIKEGSTTTSSPIQNFAANGAPACGTDISTLLNSNNRNNISHHNHNNDLINSVLGNLATANGPEGKDVAQQLLAAAAAAAQQQQQQQQQTAALLATAAAAATCPTTNLIPQHLQQQVSALAASAQSLNGTTTDLDLSSALILPMLANALGASNLIQQQQQQQALLNQIPPPPLPAMTVQDRPNTTPVYNGVNPHYPGLRVVNADPPIFCVDNFLTPLECQFLVTVASDSFGPAPVVGKGAGEVSPSRTSSTCYLAREDLPDYLRKVSLLTGKPMEHCELPQVGRYLPSQQYLQHFDAFDTSTEDGMRFAANGGQRTITVLVYLNDVQRGGATRFPALNLDIQPRQGMALVFFPATVDGYLDKMALHAAQPAVDTKFVSQVWIRQSSYNGQPSKRLTQTMGAPFTTPLGAAPTPQPLAQAQPVTSNSHTVLTNPLQQQLAQHVQQQQQQQQNHPQYQQQYQQYMQQQQMQQQQQQQQQQQPFHQGQQHQ